MDALTLWEVYDLVDYWKEFPPTHILLRSLSGALGWKAPTGGKVSGGPSVIVPTEAEVMQLVSMFNAKG